jgi:hypothetical protein
MAVAIEQQGEFYCGFMTTIGASEDAGRPENVRCTIVNGTGVTPKILG